MILIETKQCRWCDDQHLTYGSQITGGKIINDNERELLLLPLRHAGLEECVPIEYDSMITLKTWQEAFKTIF